jgi:hypothetical protein
LFGLIGESEWQFVIKILNDCLPNKF